MDPLTTLGAVAAASQLVEQSYSIVKFFSGLYGKLEEAPELTRTRISHLEQLISISKLIAKTEPLQTNEIQQALVTCLRATFDLKEVLEKYSAKENRRLKRVLNSMKVAYKEDRVMVSLDRIEKYKSLLALGIAQVPPAQLQSLHITVSEFENVIGRAAIKIDDVDTNVQTLVDVTPELARQVQALYNEIPEQLGSILEQLNSIFLSKPRPDGYSSLIAQSLKFRFQTLFLIALVLCAVVAFVSAVFQGNVLHTQQPTPAAVIYEVPNKLVKTFVGRQNVISRIKETCKAPSRRGPTIIVIRAMGGQGKTQVALEYCRELRGKMDIFWIDGTSEGTVKSNFASLSQLLDLTLSPNLDVDARVAITRRALTNRQRPWLVVFDNYDDPSSYDIRDFIPDNRFGNVIITSRHKDAEYLADEVNRIQLQGLEEADATKLLLLHSELSESDTAAVEHAVTIVDRLAYHPLAIAAAGAYINMRRLPLQKFLVEYERQKEQILKDTTPHMTEYRKKQGGSDREIPMSVFTTCELSYQQLLKQDANEKKSMHHILTLLAFFAPGMVPLRLFDAYCNQRYLSHNLAEFGVEYSDDFYQLITRPILSKDEKAPNSVIVDRPHDFRDIAMKSICMRRGRWDPGAFHQAFNDLYQLSLVEFSPQSKEDGVRHVSLHPLVRDWLRWRTPQIEWPGYASVSASCVRQLWKNSSPLSSRHTLNEIATRYAELSAGIEELSAASSRAELEIMETDKDSPAYNFVSFVYENGHIKFSIHWPNGSITQQAQHGCGFQPWWTGPMSPNRGSFGFGLLNVLDDCREIPTWGLGEVKPVSSIRDPPGSFPWRFLGVRVPYRFDL